MARKRSKGAAVSVCELVTPVEEKPVEGPALQLEPALAAEPAVEPLRVVRFYANGDVACWVGEGRSEREVRELGGRTRARWLAIQQRCTAATQFVFLAYGARGKPIEHGEVEAFVRTQQMWR